MNATENTEMYAFFELQRKRVEELNKDDYDCYNCGQKLDWSEEYD